MTASGSDIAVAAFPHVIDAERVYARVREENEGAPWLQDIAFVQRHHRGHIGIRGVFSGRYLDADDLRTVSPALFAEVSEDLEDAGSALLIFGAGDEVDTMARTLAQEHARIVRRHLSEVAAAELRTSVEQAPPAAPAP